MRILLPLLLTMTLAFSSIGLAEVKYVPFAGADYGFSTLDFPETDSLYKSTMKTNNIKGSAGVAVVIDDLHQIEPYFTYAKVDGKSMKVDFPEGTKTLKFDDKYSLGFGLFGAGIGYQINPTLNPNLSVGVGPFVEYLTGSGEECFETSQNVQECNDIDANMINAGLMASMTVAKYVTPYAKVMYSKSDVNPDGGNKQKSSGYTVSFGIRGNLDVFAKN